MISKGYNTSVSDLQLISYCLGITHLPCLMCSPLREDKHPSFCFYLSNYNRVRFIDFGTGQSGNIYDFLQAFWGCSLSEVMSKINSLPIININQFVFREGCKRVQHQDVKIECRVRDWLPKDIEYWSVYGISKDWLEFANVHPISHKIIIVDNNRYVYVAKNLAYAYAEFKDGKCTFKIYQPHEDKYKWSNNHDHSVISLWNKLPSKSSSICVCSSLKDALCLWANVGIPSIAPQGEGYKLSDTVINELKERFKYVFICLDNDQAGIEYSKTMQSYTGFINVVLPQFEGGKDISDYYKSLKDKSLFKSTILNLFINEQKRALSKNQEV